MLQIKGIHTPRKSLFHIALDILRSLLPTGLTCPHFMLILFCFFSFAHVLPSFVNSTRWVSYNLRELHLFATSEKIVCPAKIILLHSQYSFMSVPKLIKLIFIIPGSISTASAVALVSLRNTHTLPKQTSYFLILLRLLMSLRLLRSITDFHEVQKIIWNLNKELDNKTSWHILSWRWKS